MSSPILRVLGGLFLVLAGVLAYYGVGLSVAAPALFIVAGAAILVLALAGHRATRGDIALFVLGLLVLGAVETGLAAHGGEQANFSATSSQVSAHSIDLVANAGVGSVRVLFSNDSNLAYQVNFTRSVSFFTVQPFSYSLNNRSAGDTLVINATSQVAGITVTLGSKYLVNVNATSGTGSVTILAPSGEIRRLSVTTGTGSIDAVVNSPAMSSVRLTAGTGSIRFTSSSLAPATMDVPVVIETGTGSIRANVVMPRGAAVSLSAETGFGSLSHTLSGFTVTQESSGMLRAVGGDSGSSRSFTIDLSAGTGSVNISASML